MIEPRNHSTARPKNTQPPLSAMVACEISVALTKIATYALTR
jgi:hypothetical protein